MTKKIKLSEEQKVSKEPQKYKPKTCIKKSKHQ
jgi:hypothetical protein